MAKKLNLNGVKDLLFNHGEKVALGTCGFLAVLFGSLGFMDAMSAGRAESGKPWAEELQVRHDEIMRSLSVSEIPKISAQTKKMLDANGYTWPEKETNYQPQAYINVGERPDNLRQNPRALAIRSGPKGNRLDYVPALFYTYETFLAKPEVKVLDVGAAVNGPAFQKKGPGAPGMAAGGNIPFLKAGDPRRLIVGHAVFPLKDQVIEFQRALKFASQKEMFDAPREDLPVFAGFDLIKHDEFLPNGEPTDKHEVLLMWNPVTETLTISDKLKKFLSVAMFDEKSAIALEPFVFSGLTMPLPQLAFGSYPRVSFPGIEGNYDEDAGEAGPMKKGPGGERPKTGGLPGFKKDGGGGKQPAVEKDPQKADVIFDVVGMKRADLKAGGAFEQALDSRLFESDFNIFHALGLKPAPPGDAAVVNPNKGFGLRPGPGGGAAGQNDRFVEAWDIKTAEAGPDAKQGEVPVQPKQPPLKGFGPKGPGVGPEAQAPAFPNYARDAIVRFIDVDAEPGKKYQYRIRVRLKNPNYGKTTKEIAFANLAKDKEIVSAWVATEAITIPHDYHLYAIDQQLLDEGKISAADAKVKDATWFQIHQWTKTPVDQALRIGYPIGDWAVAERVLVHKGEAIGRDALVNIPFWVKEKDSFEVKKNPGNAKPGIKINMDPPIPANAGGGIVGDTGLPVLIDFTGGKRKAGGADEDVAVDALIVGPDGKLRVLNSRDAAESTPFGRDRNARLVRARQRVDEALGRTSTGTAPKKSGLPGLGN